MKLKWEHLVGALGLLLFLGTQYAGLFLPETGGHPLDEGGFGDYIRMLYVHVPAAWLAMLSFVGAFVGAMGYLFTQRKGFDWLVEACSEVGVVLGVLLMILGALFARPTWNIYWTWDARLTATAVMVLMFVGVVMLRQLVDDVDRRATWSAVVSILAVINIPITYMSVKWWRSIHQLQNTPDSVDSPIKWALYLSSLAFLLLTIYFTARRWRIAGARYRAELPPPIPEVQT